jgi:hypothetical protein
MNATRSIRIIAAVLSIAFPFTQLAYAAPANPPVQAPQDPPPSAPVPSQIAAAHTVFLVNGGADHNFPIAEDQAYNSIYAALKTWGRFQLVDSPAQADLILNLHDIAPVTAVGGGDRTEAYAITSPAFQLTLTDARTNIALWTITSPVYISGKGQTRAGWTNIAITNLVSRVKVLVNQPLSETESADLTRAPKRHTVAGIVLVSGVVAGSVGVGFLLKHEFDQAVKNQNTMLCAENPFFCNNPAATH